jgi:hypothetical protein
VLTLTLAAVVLGLVLIREWMAQHILTDPTKPPEQLPEIRKPIYVMNGIVYNNRHDAYLSYAMDVELPMHENLRTATEFQRAKHAILLTALKNRLDVRIKDVQIYLRGNPFIGEKPLNPDFVEKIKNLDFDGTVGDLRSGPDPELMSLYPTVHGIMERLFDARKGCTDPLRDAFGAEISKMGDGNLEPVKDQSVDKDSLEDILGSLQVPPMTLPPSLSGVDNPHWTPPAASPTQVSTPPRPCNADDQGFDEHVSYTAPELIDNETQEAQTGAAEGKTENAGPAGSSNHMSEQEQTRQARLARFEKRQSMKAKEETAIRNKLAELEAMPNFASDATAPEAKRGESSRPRETKKDINAEDADGWETDNSEGHASNASSGTSQKARPSLSPKAAPVDLEEMRKRNMDMIRAKTLAYELKQAALIGNPDPNAGLLEGHEHLIMATSFNGDGSRYPVRNPINPPNTNGTVYFVRDPLRPDVPIRPLDLPPLPAFAPIPRPDTVAPGNDAEDDGEDEEGEDEDEQEEEPEPEAHPDDHHHHHDHDHDQDELDELDREDWNGVLEGK